ncbi:MAG TPA: TraR/DksA C4-type zinc finger protein [Candidatus Tectomicrobia bacterium]|nr:TraR/DksA C4-type zinc finger protein [Candidatus Tectomicrobia bacterium]
MDKIEREALVQTLHRQREALLKDVADTEAEQRLIAESRNAELEERAQQERLACLLARLDDRQIQAFQAIEAALQRVVEVTYGTCTDCGQAIALERLRALPATPVCTNCARRQEKLLTAGIDEEVPRTGRIHADMSLTTDRELESAIRELVREDGRVDIEELRIVCRHGVVYLDGSLPSEEEHSIVLQLVRDVAGLEEVVDRVGVMELLWEREDRSKAASPEGRLPTIEGTETEDVVQSIEEGIDYVPPMEPPPEER